MSSVLNAGQAACTVTTKRQAPPLPSPTIPPRQAPRLLDQLREQIRYLHYSMSTEDAYVHWCKAFILFHGKQHPKVLGGERASGKLRPRRTSKLCRRCFFLYTKVLAMNLPSMQEIGRPRVKRRLPVVLSRDEVAVLFCHHQGPPLAHGGL